MRKIKDKGLLWFGGILIILGIVVFVREEGAITTLHVPTEIRTVDGVEADIMALFLVVGGVYFIRQSIK